MNKWINKIIGVLLVVNSVGIVKAQTAKRIQFPGTKISVMVPDSFSHAGRFNGFQSPSGSLSLMLSEVPQGIEYNKSGFTQEKLQRQGIELKGSEEIIKGNQTWYLYTMQLQLKREPYIKYVLLLGDSDKTAMISAFCPVIQKHNSEGMKAMVKTIEYDEAALIDPWSAMSFTIDLSFSGLKFTRYSLGGVIYSKDGSYPSKGEDHTAIVAGSSVRGFTPQSQRDITLKRLHALPVADSIKIFREDSVILDGLKGYEFEARGVNPAGQTEYIYFVMLFESDQKYYLLACNSNLEGTKNIAMFRKIVRTFKRNKDK